MRRFLRAAQVEGERYLEIKWDVYVQRGTRGTLQGLMSILQVLPVLSQGFLLNLRSLLDHIFLLSGVVRHPGPGSETSAGWQV